MKMEYCIKKKASRRLLRLTTTYLLTLNNEKKLLTENYKQLTNLKLLYFLKISLFSY